MTVVLLHETLRTLIEKLRPTVIAILVAPTHVLAAVQTRNFVGRDGDRSLVVPEDFVLGLR
eukprot:11171454-Lingulodinium_polyedra.AAC.1